MACSADINGRHQGSRRGWMLAVLLALCAGLAPHPADANPSSIPMRVSATVLPRCQEWNAAAGGFQTNSTRFCAPGSVAVVHHQAGALSVKSAPGLSPQVIRQSDPAGGVELLVVAF